MGLLSLLRTVLREEGSLDECKGCGQYCHPGTKHCPDCIEQNRQELWEGKD